MVDIFFDGSLDVRWCKCKTFIGYVSKVSILRFVIFLHFNVVNSIDVVHIYFYYAYFVNSYYL